MLGYPEDQEDVLPDWYRLVHPDDMARVQAKMREHLEGKSEFFESVHRMKHQNGEWRWMTSRAKARQDEKGRLIRLLGVEVDITERKLYEEALFREKESAQITLRSIGDGVITTDAECNVEYVNPVAEELTGWKVDDASRRPIDEIFRSFHEETCEPIENPLSVAIRRSRSIKSVRPTLLIRRDGNELYIESTASPIRDGKGEVTGGVLVFHDVSESRELNRRLSYHASHDILTGLVNRAEFESRPGRHRTHSATLIWISSRSSTIPAATAPATPCWASWVLCSKRRSAGATRWHGSAATNSASCWKAAASMRP